jgi:hypothetical protein
MPDAPYDPNDEDDEENLTDIGDLVEKIIQDGGGGAPG